MKANLIVVGLECRALVDGKWRKVRITSVAKGKKDTSFRFEVVETGKKGAFKSAAKFKPLEGEQSLPPTAAKPPMKSSQTPAGQSDSKTFKPKPGAQGTDDQYGDQPKTKRVGSLKGKLKHSATGLCGKKKVEGEKRPDPITSNKSAATPPLSGATTVVKGKPQSGTATSSSSPVVPPAATLGSFAERFPSLAKKASESRASKSISEAPPKSGSQATSPESLPCLGFTPNIVSGLCRCRNCQKKPRNERTQAPVVSPAAPPVSTSGSKLPAPVAQPRVSSAASLQVDTLAAVPSVVRPSPIATAPRSSGLGAKLGMAPLIDKSPHLVIDAKAGTGKTTTGVEGLKILLGFGTHLEPSPEQKAIWDALQMSKGFAGRICYTSMGRDITAELKRRVPPGVQTMTTHGMGFRGITSRFRLWGGERSVCKFRVSNILEEMLGGDIRVLKQTMGGTINVVEEVVRLAKVNLLGRKLTGGVFQVEPAEVDVLIDHFDIDMEGVDVEEVYNLVPRVMERCLDIGRDRYIDYADMIWAPVVLNLPVDTYDLLVVDEAQDLNRCQQALMMMAIRHGGRIVMCGDPKQAIFGFAGADCESMHRMTEVLQQTERGVVVLPLTVTRRCGKAIVAEANQIVREFSAHESNPEGKVSTAVYPTDSKGKERPKPHYTDRAKDGDMVLCRVNAPLVSQCFRFIKEGRKANILGRDMGDGLVKTVEKLKASCVGELLEKMDEWLEREMERERKKKFPNEAKIIAVQDKFDCIVCFTEGLDMTALPMEVVNRIKSVFVDEKDGQKVTGIKLSSIHKAKGLEAETVFLLEPAGCSVPHPMAKSAWQMEQEWNLRYVAITRAIKELVYVS